MMLLVSSRSVFVVFVGHRVAVRLYGSFCSFRYGPFCPVIPNDSVALHTVMGKPLTLPRIPQPTDVDVAKWHQTYMNHLDALFERHKTRFGYGDRKLEML